MPDIFSISGKKIWLSGHNGLVGSALLKRLQHEDCQILTVAKSELDLCNQAETYDWVAEHKPDVAIIAAAKVGGIGANAKFPAEFLHDNLAIAQNTIHAAYKNKISKLVFLGSSCIYPKYAEQPIYEDALLTGELEQTNEAYAIAKIAGIKLCQYYRRQYGCDFISLMPCNIYGAGDHWQDKDAHVIPSLISRIHAAKLNGDKEVEIWGSGAPLREFLYVEDVAEAVLLALRKYSHQMPLNVGSGIEISIRELAEMIQDVIGYKGHFKFDLFRPDGTPRKLLSSERMRGLGWSPVISLEKGLKLAYEDFLSA